MLTRPTSAFVFIGILTLPVCWSASFNCKQASTSVDKMICNDVNLNIKDSYMSLLYAKLVDAESNKALLSSQKEWLKLRNRCTTLLCLTDSYDKRIAELSKMSAPSIGFNRSAKGIWTASYSNQVAASTLTINKLDKNGFNYKIETNNGVQTGEIEERAFLIGNDALTIDSSVIDGESFDTPCIILLQAYATQLQVTQNYSCGYFAGHGVSFAGSYVRDKEPTIASLHQLGLLESSEQEKAFKAMAGKDYQQFVDGCGGSVGTEESINPKALVHTGFLRGAAPYTACIILTNQNKLWAAVINTNKDTQINYFTNVPEYNQVLPEPISQWVKELEKTRNEKLQLIYPGS